MKPLLLLILVVLLSGCSLTPKQSRFLYEIGDGLEREADRRAGARVTQCYQYRNTTRCVSR